MRKKILKSLVLFALTAVAITLIVVFEIKNLPVGGSIGGLIAGLSIPSLGASFVDFGDNTNWKTSQRKLQRGKIINKDTVVRISFAYLFRIKVDGKYLLVKNSRGTGKFQPVGGVYKFKDEEARYLRQEFSSEDDDKIPVDESSKGDYRLQFKNQHLRKFVRRFNRTKNRENIENLSREFKEELFGVGMLKQDSFGPLTYTYCGRHMTELKYGEHFQCYELLLADVVHVELTMEQEQKFRELMGRVSEKYTFASDEEIKSLGVKVGSSDLIEKISDHTKKILIENTNELTKPWNSRGRETEYTCQI